jgi:pyruvate ferredoxin oxidoreductase delta subunit
MRPNMKKEVYKSKKAKWDKLPKGGVIDEGGTSLYFKTGNWSKKKPLRDKKKCINCLHCWMVCPDNAIRVKNGKIKKIDPDYCKGCGLCEYICPVKAIKMVDKEKND